MKNEHINTDVFTKLTELYKNGIVLNNLNMLAGQPFDTIKVHGQKNNQGFWLSTQALAQGKGLASIPNFYNGFTANWTRRNMSLLWRVPLNTEATKLTASAFNLYDENGKPSHMANMTAAFLLNAPVDTTLSCWLELAKVTKQTGGTYQQLMEQAVKNNQFFRVMWRGAFPMYWKSSMAYAALFTTNKIADEVNSHYNKDQPMPYWVSFPTGFMTGFIKVVLTNPADVVKTHMQSAGNEGVLSTLATMKHLKNNFGYTVFFRQASARLVHATLAGIAGSYLMNVSDRQNGEKKPGNTEPGNLQTHVERLRNRSTQEEGIRR